MTEDQYNALFPPMKSSDSRSISRKAEQAALSHKPRIPGRGLASSCRADQQITQSESKSTGAARGTWRYLARSASLPCSRYRALHHGRGAPNPAGTAVLLLIIPSPCDLPTIRRAIFPCSTAKTTGSPWPPGIMPSAPPRGGRLEIISWPGRPRVVGRALSDVSRAGSSTSASPPTLAEPGLALAHQTFSAHGVRATNTRP